MGSTSVGSAMGLPDSFPAGRDLAIYENLPTLLCRNGGSIDNNGHAHGGRIWPVKMMKPLMWVGECAYKTGQETLVDVLEILSVTQVVGAR